VGGGVVGAPGCPSFTLTPAVMMDQLLLPIREIGSTLPPQRLTPFSAGDHCLYTWSDDTDRTMGGRA
jgi:hypothetical protein